jgi:hypothetical protein
MAEDHPGAALDERDREMLDFEREWWRYAGAKEQAIKARFELSTTRYYELLNRLIDRDEAVEYDPMLVKRLRRLRAQRQRQRAARRASNY